MTDLPLNQAMTLDQALPYLRDGHRLMRGGWNGKGMYVELQVPDLNSKMSLPYVFIKTADDHLVPWLCSQTDLLADDWFIYAPDAAASAPLQPAPLPPSSQQSASPPLETS